MKQKFLDFMKDRYGGDILNNIIIYLSLGFGIVNLFKKSDVLAITFQKIKEKEPWSK